MLIMAGPGGGVGGGLLNTLCWVVQHEHTDTERETHTHIQQIAFHYNIFELQKRRQKTFTMWLIMQEFKVT